MAQTWPFRRALFLVAFVFINRSSPDDHLDRCELLIIPECIGMPYNITMAPNTYDSNPARRYAGQLEHRDIFYEFDDLMQSECSPLVRYFLCSLFFPWCSNQGKRQMLPWPPCRDICSHVKYHCIEFFRFSQSYPMPWPEVLSCDHFPQGPGKNRHRCHDMDSAADYLRANPAISKPLPFRPRPTVYPWKNLDISAQVRNAMEPDTSRLTTLGLVTYSNLAVAPESYAVLRVPCDGKLHFTDQMTSVVEFVIAGLAVVAFLSSGSTALTAFIFRNQRFLYPQRPIAFIALSNVFVVFAVVLRLIGGRRFGCDADGRFLVVSGDYGSGECITQFVFFYLFQHSACIWWIIFTFVWFLSTSRMWSPEAFQPVSKYFHLIAWGIPSCLTLAAVLWKKVDADELSGICSVGNGDNEGLLVFVVLPVVCYLVFGGSFVIAGIIAAVNVRNFLRTIAPADDVQFTPRMDALIYKVALFSMLFLISLACVLGFGVGQLAQWKGSKGQLVEDLQDFRTCLRIVFPLLVGVLSGGWICNMKTFRSWQSKIRGWRASPSAEPIFHSVSKGVSPPFPTLPVWTQGSAYNST